MSQFNQSSNGSSGDIDLKETEIINENAGIYLGIAFLFASYSILIFISGAWGNSILTPSCVNGSLRTALRGLLVVGMMSLISFIGYGVCRLVCREVISHQLGGTYRSSDMDVTIPTWIIGFTLILTIINLVFQSTIASQIDSADCKTSSSDTFKKFNSFCMVVSILILVVIVVIFGSRMYKHQKGGRVKKQKQIDEARKGVTELVNLGGPTDKEESIIIDDDNDST